MPRPLPLFFAFFDVVVVRRAAKACATGLGTRATACGLRRGDRRGLRRCAEPAAAGAAAGYAAAPMERARRFLAAVRGLKREREGILNAKRFVRTQIQNLR